jgi:hypothetical protein
MRSYADAVIEAADRELADWRVGERIPLRESMSNISIDVIIHTVFGVQADDQVKAMRTASARATRTRISKAALHCVKTRTCPALHG